MKNSVLVLGCTRHTLSVTRSLAARGYRVILGMQQSPAVAAVAAPADPCPVDAFSSRFLAYSRSVSECWEHCEFVDPSHFISEVLAFLKCRPDVKAIFPVGELAMSILARGGILSKIAVPAVMPDSRATLRCLDKRRMYRIADRSGLPIPPTRVAESIHELHIAAREIGFPCVIKPRNSFRRLTQKKKAFVARSIEEVEELLPTWPEGIAGLIVQRMIKGTRYNCMFTAKDGRLTQYFEARVCRTMDKEGFGSAVELESAPPDMMHLRHTQRLIGNLSYSGIGEVRFLVEDETQREYFLEINPRVDATSCLAQSCGIDLPSHAVALALGSEAVSYSLDLSYPVEVRGHWLYADIRGLAGSVVARELGFSGVAGRAVECLLSFFKSHAHGSWSWRDPFPTLVLYSGFGSSILSLGKSALPLRTPQTASLAP